MAQCRSRGSPAALRRRVSPGLPLSRTPGGARVGESLVDATPSSNGAHHVVVRFERETIRSSCWKRPRSRRSSRAGAHDAPLEQTNSSIVWLPVRPVPVGDRPGQRCGRSCLRWRRAGGQVPRDPRTSSFCAFTTPLRGACVIRRTGSRALRGKSHRLRGNRHTSRFLRRRPRFLRIL